MFQQKFLSHNSSISGFKINQEFYYAKYGSVYLLTKPKSTKIYMNELISL